jgi:hypothetical protein
LACDWLVFKKAPLMGIAEGDCKKNELLEPGYRQMEPQFERRLNNLPVQLLTLHSRLTLPAVHPSILSDSQAAAEYWLPRKFKNHK